MKKLPAVLSATVFLIIVSCTDTTRKEVRKETTVTPVEKVSVKEEKPTSISIDKGGVKVETKKVDVKVGQ